MPWVIGIDEAGYGPNLGPLMQAAARAKLPHADPAGWKTFEDKIRRYHEPKDHRILVDDSKKIYYSGTGLNNLHDSLAGWMSSGLSEKIRACGVLDSWDDLQAEYWHFHDIIHAFPCPPCPLHDVGLDPKWINVVMPGRLNRMIADSGTKATALLRGYIGLVQSIFQNWQPDESVVIFADKHGGRHYYAALMQEAFPNGWVISECESPGESRYRILNLDFELTAIFRPRADSGSICVALASMMAKYLREKCMIYFNAFWAKHVPGLQPTAGYPGDAKRFYREIEPAMKKLGIAKDAVWRMK